MVFFMLVTICPKSVLDFMITVNNNIDSFTIKPTQEIEEVDTNEHYQPKISIGIIDVALRQMM